MLKGLRRGIEKASTLIVPTLCVLLVVLLVRALTLPGAMEGVSWYILKFRLSDLTPAVVVGALGHMMFSLSLGGTFMVVYGSYLKPEETTAAPAIWTVAGDTGSALFAGLAIIPAVFAMGLEPTSGPGLIFSTLPKVFAALPLGWIFGALFFLGLMGAGYLSNVGAFEVLVAGLTDNTRLSRTTAVWLISAAVFRRRDSALHQQRDLRPLGSHVRFRNADARLPAGGDHRGLVHEPFDRAGRHGPRRRAPGSHVAHLLDTLRHSRGDSGRGHLVAHDQRPSCREARCSECLFRPRARS